MLKKSQTMFQFSKKGENADNESVFSSGAKIEVCTI